MSLDDLNQAAAAAGGRWLKLRFKSDAPIDGTLVDYSTRPKTFEGQPVLNRTTGEQRIEGVIIVQTDLREDGEDDGLRKVSANEAMQRALGKAIRDAGGDPQFGGRLRIGVVEDPPNDRAQATYAAKYEPPTARIAVDDLFAET